MGVPTKRRSLTGSLHLEALLLFNGNRYLLIIPCSVGLSGDLRFNDPLFLTEQVRT